MSGEDAILRYYSAALDEIYRLRAAMAYEATERDADLALKGFPRSRRADATRAADRMRSAARGHCGAVYRKQDNFDSKTALTAAGASDCLTRAAWEQEVDAYPAIEPDAMNSGPAPDEYDQTRQRWSLALAAALEPDDQRIGTLHRNTPLLLLSAEWARDDSATAWQTLTDDVENHYLTAALHNLAQHRHPEFGNLRGGSAKELIGLHHQAGRLLSDVALRHTAEAAVLQAVLTQLLSRHTALDVQARLRDAARTMGARKEFKRAGYRWSGHSTRRPESSNPTGEHRR